ncbi:MAG TPA: CoA ester lyase [Dehalococcoidia bacterium]
MSRLLRTLQIVPALDPAALEAAARSTADAVVLDLSRAISDTERDRARRQAADAVPGLAVPGREVWVQVGDALSLRTRDDVAALARPEVTGFCLPRTESARQVLFLEALLRDREAALGLEEETFKAIPWIETALGLGACQEIVRASRRVVAVALDGAGYAEDLGLERTPEDAALLYARGAVVQAAGQAEVLALDGPYPVPGDRAGLVEETERVRALGFHGKFVLDQEQAEAVGLMLRPTPAQVEGARRLHQAFQAAQDRGERAAVVDGRYVDAVVAARAKRVLDLAAAIEEKERAGAGRG